MQRERPGQKSATGRSAQDQGLGYNGRSAQGKGLGYHGRGRGMDADAATTIRRAHRANAAESTPDSGWLVLSPGRRMAVVGRVPMD